MNYSIKSVVFLLCSAVTAGFTASANDVVQAACEADAAQSRYNCGCLQQQYSSASAGLPDNHQAALADFIAMSLSDTEAAARFSALPPTTLIALPLGELDGMYEACLSDNFHQDMAALEADAELAEAEQDAIIAAEEERIAAIPTAPEPPEVTNPPETLPPIGAEGVRLATSFRDVVIADCRSFGNKIGFCACNADEMEKQLPPLATKAYFATSKFNATASTADIISEEAEVKYYASMGMTQDDIDIGISSYNSFVQSRDREDISYACQAYY